MSQAEVLALVVSVLEVLGIDHMLVGSHASSFYGEARSTYDVDFVIDARRYQRQNLDFNNLHRRATALRIAEVRQRQQQQ